MGPDIVSPEFAFVLATPIREKRMACSAIGSCSVRMCGRFMIEVPMVVAGDHTAAAMQMLQADMTYESGGYPMHG